MQRSGRCHESEIRAALGREFVRYRNPQTLSDGALRDMVRNWHPGADRTATGYYKNLSLRPFIDPFTGEAQGSAVPVGAAAQKEGL